MINFPNLIKDYIIYKFNTFLFTMFQIDYDKYKRIEYRKTIIETIEEIKNITIVGKLEQNLFKNITSFLYGDFIEVTFQNNNEYSFYFFKRDIISSETLLKLFYKSKTDNKNIFRLDINYNSKFFKLLVNYLIYNDNKDHIGTMEYNPSWLYLRDSDEFNNGILVGLNYLELRRFQIYIRYFKIKVLDYKVATTVDIITVCKRNAGLINTNPISDFI